jgi:hypothetical protein
VRRDVPLEPCHPSLREPRGRCVRTLVAALLSFAGNRQRHRHRHRRPPKTSRGIAAPRAVAQSPRESAANLRRDAAGIEPKETFHVASGSLPLSFPDARLRILSPLVNNGASFDPETSPRTFITLELQHARRRIISG